MPFAIDPVCGKVVDPESSGLEITTNGIAFPFCSKECAAEFKRNRSDYLYCPWKPKRRIDPNVSAEVYGKTIYFCCTDCRDNAVAFAAIQTNTFGLFGVRVKIDQARARQNLDNFAVVTEALKDSPAAKLGIEKGSAILSIDGSEMNDYRKVFMWMRLSKPGQEALFEIKTPGGTTRKMKVVLGSRGDYQGGLTRQEPAILY